MVTYLLNKTCLFEIYGYLLTKQNMSFSDLFEIYGYLLTKQNMSFSGLFQVVKGKYYSFAYDLLIRMTSIVIVSRMTC